MKVVDAHDPRGRTERQFTVVTGADLGLQMNLEDALAYLLVAHGYNARVTGAAEVPVGSYAQGRSGNPQLVISPTLRASGVRTVVTWVAGRSAGKS